MSIEQTTSNVAVLSRGAAALTCVTLLLMLTTLAGTFGATFAQLNLKIALNAQHKQRIDALANAKLTTAISELQSRSVRQQVIEQQQSDQVYEYQLSSRLINDIAQEPFSLFGLSASVTSIDSRANATQSQNVLSYSMLDTIPAAPLIVDGAMLDSDKVTIVANPNGAGTNVPISVWTSEPISELEHLPTTCQPFEFRLTRCVDSALTKPGFKAPDVVDVAQPFPGELLDYVFPFSTLDWINIKDQATTILTSCDSLTTDSKGLIWIEGNCSLPLGLQLGSLEQPILLVIKDGQLILPSNAEIYGLMILFRQQNQLVEIDVIDNATVYGSVMSNTALRFVRDRLLIIYDGDLLTRLQGQRLMRRVVPITGSWRDF
ncbi:hypothetical protein [Aliiglaciecola litoralis]|uniref:Tfp pilus assembly protein PilX n=1 Tax=Aliiglaciecola litoralis TaxID=582857 RepID=A0ABP3WX38_9ALTE